MRAGKLRHRIVIQQPTESQSTSGAVTNSWGTFKTVWAEVEPRNGREFFNGAQMVEELTLTMRIRYMPDLSPKMRIFWKARAFDILGIVDVLGTDKEMIIACRELFNVGITENAFTTEFTAEFA